MNRIKVSNVKSKDSERSLGVCMSPSIVWIAQFEKMKEKMMEAMRKLKNATMVISTASMHSNMCLIKNVYFRCGIMSLTPQQEKTLKKMCEPIILKKLGLSQNFSRAALHSRKSALGVGLLTPRTIADELSLKFHLGQRRAEDRIGNMMQIIEDNERSQCGYSKSMMEVNRLEKPKNITQSDEIQEKLERHGMKLENRVNEPKRFTENKTIMEMAAEHAREIDDHKIVAPINQARIRKKMMLPRELVGFKGERKTKEAWCNEDASCVMQKNQFDNVSKPSKKSYEIWNKFADWIIDKKVETIIDFNNEIDTIYKITRDKKCIKKKIDEEEVVCVV